MRANLAGKAHGSRRGRVERTSRGGRRGSSEPERGGKIDQPPSAVSPPESSVRADEGGEQYGDVTRTSARSIRRRFELSARARVLSAAPFSRSVIHSRRRALSAWSFQQQQRIKDARSPRSQSCRSRNSRAQHAEQNSTPDLLGEVHAGTVLYNVHTVQWRDCRSGVHF